MHWPPLTHILACASCCSARRCIVYLPWRSALTAHALSCYTTTAACILKLWSSTPCGNTSCSSTCCSPYLDSCVEHLCTLMSCLFPLPRMAHETGRLAHGACACCCREAMGRQNRTQWMRCWLIAVSPSAFWNTNHRARVHCSWPVSSWPTAHSGTTETWHNAHIQR